MGGKIINFFKGYASNRLVPKQAISHAYSKVLLDTDFDQFDTDPDNRHPLSYGTDPGNLEVRQTISTFLGSNFGISPPNPDCINLTCGASFGIGVVLNRATDPSYTERVFIVTPCYFLINPTFIDAGFSGKITSINETPTGKYQIDLQLLEEELEKLSPASHTLKPDSCERPASKVYKSVIYIVPSFSNPGGLNYSLETRVKLIDLARKYDMLIICDDVYDLLDYTGNPPLPRLCHLDRDTCDKDGFGNVVSNASTSKIIAPGLRFGWHETVSPKLAEQFSQEGCTKSGGTPTQLASFAIRELMESGKINDIIANFVKTYSERAEIMKQCILKYLPESTKFYGGEGGYFIWVEVDPKYNLLEIIGQLAKQNVILASGNEFEVVENVQGLSNCVRLCFSYVESEDIETGIKAWGELMK